MKLTDDHLGKEIEIKCTGAGVLSLDKFTNFQGSFKKLEEEGYQRLKTSILILGFSYPVAIWQHKNKNFVLDANQRLSALARMRDEGYVIPPLPVVLVEADDHKQAARKLLAAASQYGTVQAVGLNLFMENFDIELTELKDTFLFPEIDLKSFEDVFFAPEVEPPKAPKPPPKTITRPAEKPADGPRDTTFLLSDEFKESPEHVREEAFRSLTINFRDQDSFEFFASMIKQKIPDSKKQIWFPEKK